MVFGWRRSFGSRVERRVYITLLLMAILPIGGAAVWSYLTVRDELYQSSYRDLRDYAKTYGITVWDRLQQLNLTLAQVERAHTNGQDHALDSDLLERQFAWIAIADANGEVFQEYVRTIPTPSRVRLATAKKTLVQLLEQGARRDVVVARPPFDESGHQVIGVPNERYLWGEASDAPYGVNVWVVGIATGTNVWCTLVFCEAPAGVQPNEALFWNVDGHDVMAAAWELYLPSAFAAQEGWKFVAGRPASLALEPLMPFRLTFSSAMLLTCLVVALLGAREVRRRLVPLDRLVVAAGSIASGNYGTRVEVGGGDEFQQLGESFNEMSEQLHSVFGTLNALSEIDRLILADPELEGVSAEVLEHCTNLFAADVGCVAVFRPEQDTANLFWKKPSTTARREVVPATAEGRALFGGANVPRWFEAGELHAHLSASIFPQTLRYYVVPVQHRAATGGLCLGFRADVERLALGHLRDFADRIAVALESLEARKVLYRRAHYDGLTGLPNRQLFMDRLHVAMDRARRESTYGALMFVDLDHFKQINDTEGHAVGDLLLMETANRLRSAVRATDTVARLGGDEFTLLLEGLHRPEDAARVAEQLIQGFNNGMLIEEKEYRVTASIGISIFPQEGHDAEQLLVDADLAMYRIKRTQRGTYGFYSDELNRDLAERRDVENRMRVALRDENFTLAYQPQVNWRTGETWGVEALLRWTDHALGEVPPARFIPVAEDTGLIIELGEWVLLEGCRQFVQWAAEGRAVDRISFNISHRQFSHPGFIALLERVVRDTGIVPAALQLELTETLLIKDTAATTRVFESLRRLGLGIALDDFGTGYSSLGYLRSLPFDVIKIDKSFIDELEASADARSVVEAIVALARALGKELIAEGVETACQRDQLAQLGCEIGQGFLFSKPLAPDALLAFLGKDKPRKARTADGK